MSLIVEDGTGINNAQSYLGVVDADTYFSTRNVSAWTGTNAAKESALIIATEYIDIRWGKQLKGELEFRDTQALLFPRLNIYDEQGRSLSGVPERLERATAEYALISLTQDLMPNPTVEANGKILIEQSEGIGPLTETKKYQSGYLATKPYPKADNLMSCFLLNSGVGRVYV